MGVFDIFKKKEPDFGVEEEPLRRLRSDEVEMSKPKFTEDFAPRPLAFTSGKDVSNEVINAKLDSVINKLELMDKRLQDIEKIAKEE